MEAGQFSEHTFIEKSTQYYSLYLASTFWIFEYTCVHTQAHIYFLVYTIKWADWPAQSHWLPLKMRWESTGMWNDCEDVLAMPRVKCKWDVWPLAWTLVFSTFGVPGLCLSRQGAQLSPIVFAGPSSLLRVIIYRETLHWIYEILYCARKFRMWMVYL